MRSFVNKEFNLLFKSEALHEPPLKEEPDNNRINFGILYKREADNRKPLI